MSKSLLFLPIVFLSLHTFSQSVLCGRVIDEKTKKPIQSMIFLSHSEDYIQADSLGAFCIDIDSTKTVYFSSPTYSLYKLNVSEPYTTIELSIAKKPERDYSSSGYYLTDRDNPLTGFSPSFSISFLNTDYSEFEDVLEPDLIKGLENVGTIKFELAGYVDRFYIGVGYGSWRWPSTESDIENITTSVGHFSANIGYNLINRKVILTPHIGYFSYKNRAKTNDSDANLNDYLGNRGIDLKFVGYFAKAGLDFQYVISERSDHCFLGARVNYLYQFGDTVIKNNFGDKLSSDKNINFDNLNIELIFTIFTN
jgi:hypothetical protein